MIRDILTRFIAIASFLTSYTSTKIDDEVLAFAQAVVDSPALLAWLETLINAPEGTQQLVGPPPELLVEELRERRIDWAKLLERLPALIALVKAFM